ncbi:P-II family nitrogen regulator [Streptococcus merionis]|uniref:P-II family nitrogen regulator n=1 Tax=Streptococcus merionis TaxID=400065 RepID=UPI0035196CEC
MNTIEEIPSLELLYVIVNYGQGSRVLELAKKIGFRGGTVLPALGTVKHPFLNFLSLYDVEKEVVLMASQHEKTQELMTHLDSKIHFEKPHHGLMFTIPICQIIGSRTYQSTYTEKTRGEEGMYHLITTVVERGNAEDVIEAAEAAGSQGGTIINGRGSGINETTRLFNMDIEPEKEVVWIIAPKDDSDRIVQSIRTHLAIDEPGRGIIFIQTIGQIYGLHKGLK